MFVGHGEDAFFLRLNARDERFFFFLRFNRAEFGMKESFSHYFERRHKKFRNGVAGNFRN